MANIRSGSKGSYYGSFFYESEPLYEYEMQTNAKYIYKYLSSKGFTLNAICGMLGNMEVESSLNPGRWQSDDVDNTSLGYGLVQWTPATKYINWCGDADPSSMDSNLARIIYELENNLQWIATDDYNLSFSEFSKSTKNVDYLTTAFLKNYERAGVEVLTTRISNANNWYYYLKENGASVDSGGSGSTTHKKKKRKFKFILFKRRMFY